DRAEHNLNFNDFSDEINFSTELVMYTIGKQFVAVGSRDSEWVFRDINFEKDTVPPTRPLQSKYHELWNRTEVRGRLQATQSCEHNLYVSKMLGLFKAELKALWYNSRGREGEKLFSKRRNTHALSCALQASQLIFIIIISYLF
ncbi:hypothetical protein DFH28DRAFT_906916, partial [Melampsora americana]